MPDAPVTIAVLPILLVSNAVPAFDLINQNFSDICSQRSFRIVSGSSMHSRGANFGRRVDLVETLHASLQRLDNGERQSEMYVFGTLLLYSCASGLLLG